MTTYTHARYMRGGYEVSSAGDRRFSAFNAIMPDSRSIEHHYQCDVKGYDPGGTNWRAGKGKPPLNPSTDLWAEYLALWRTWVRHNPHMLKELVRCLKAANTTCLTDKFASSAISQARALAYLLNQETH